MGLFRKKKNSLEHFLQEVAPNWPDEHFTQEETVANSTGQKINPHWCYLDRVYFWFFKSVDINDFEGVPHKTFMFKSNDTIDIDNLKKLVNELVEYFGKCNNGYGKFARYERREIEDNTWMGRSWTDDHHKHPVMLGYNESEGLYLTIFYSGGKDPLKRH